MPSVAPVSTNKPPSSELIYYFWLFDWNTRTIDVLTHVQPAYTLCEIRQSELSIATSGARFSTSLVDIKEIRLWRWASAGAKVTINVEIRFVQPISVPGRDCQSAVLYLVPMDVYTFDTSLKESEDMVQVLDILKSGDMPEVEPNPYLRRKRPRWSISRAKMAVECDPTTPPYQYTEPPYSLRITLLTFIVIAVTAIITVPIIGIVLNALFGRH